MPGVAAAVMNACHFSHFLKIPEIKSISKSRSLIEIYPFQKIMSTDDFLPLFMKEMGPI